MILYWDKYDMIGGMLLMQDIILKARHKILRVVFI